jgi:hypothetical protein
MKAGWTKSRASRSHSSIAVIRQVPPKAPAATTRSLTLDTMPRRQLDVTLAGRPRPERAGAAALVAADQPAEALALFRETMALACRALDPRGDPGAEPAALLAAIHGHLLPAKLMTELEASALARAGESARAFGVSTVTPPDAIVGAVAADAAALLARARATVARDD